MVAPAAHHLVPLVHHHRLLPLLLLLLPLPVDTLASPALAVPVRLPRPHLPAAKAALPVPLLLPHKVQARLVSPTFSTLSSTSSISWATTLLSSRGKETRWSTGVSFALSIPRLRFFTNT